MSFGNIKYGICEWSLPVPMRGPSCAKFLKDFGMTGIELDLGLTEDGFPLGNPYVIECYKEAKEQYGVDYTGIAVNLTDFYPMTAPASDEGRQLVTFAVHRALDAAQALDIPLIHVPSFFKSQLTTEEDLKYTAECFQNFCDYGKEKGILVCTENNIDTPMQLQMIEMVDRDNFGVYFDTQNYYVNGLKTADLIEPIFKYIPECHVKDGYQELSTHMIGTGGASVFETLQKLSDLNYSGYLLLENYFSRPALCPPGSDVDPFDLIRKDLAILKDFVEKH